MTTTAPPTTLVDQLAGILRRARGERTRASVAAEAGVTPVALLHIEEATANPTLKRVAELGDLYGARLALVDLNALELTLEDELDPDAYPTTRARRRAVTAIIRNATAQEPRP